MAESAEYHERRQYQRSQVSSGVIAVLITSSPEIIGSVTDISLGGAKVTYHYPKDKTVNFDKLKLDLISDDRYVEAIPCNNAWDSVMTTGELSETGDLRQCGLQFADLTPNQLFLLRGFINRCAAPEVASQQQADIHPVSSH